MTTLLTATQKKACQSHEHNPAPNGPRAKALLAINSGATQQQAAADSGLSIGQVRYCLRRFRLVGLDVFTTLTTTKNSATSTQKTKEKEPKKKSGKKEKSDKGSKNTEKKKNKKTEMKGKKKDSKKVKKSKSKKDKKKKKK
ncbi:helix-turn-helix domain-containing protein [Alcanivorax sp.]|uniref:helix-turn-helix domain-containing protein n=1 Tax=Alcanivorax sp. TaxID=1872427 RepID=UPI0025C738C5|nr:helix-turn-helix domain-containing protein [Alcanivorax sp.]|tara:strand:- start:394 stop:816 length:423 start_codon:yes stop_codon:yes gene_type:complete